MDHRFREDENELPYLVVQKRDGFPKQSTETRKQEGSVIDILKTLDLEIYEQFLIYKKLNEFLEAKDVVGIEVLDSFDEISFLVIRENEYIKTVSEFIYFPGKLNEKRVFFDCYSTHSHDRLLSNPRFQRLINDVPYEFVEVGGGYEVKYRGADDIFELLDEINVKVIFRLDSKTKRIYFLNLDTMTLRDKYWDV